ncbi:hypothetical protein SH1V18_17900 [Vallitalea longa]|uniref:Lipoprotein n=1 Tax=Vallitalea longa TaxID=2936439 RepID=A0A9W6DEA8_9FIRM|nr:hypothetical protein [Vallitalea longa]GKX29310.1 hypothetical protein SH1V18_17900 [Vallitalea longa]
MKKFILSGLMLILLLIGCDNNNIKDKQELVTEVETESEDNNSLSEQGEDSTWYSMYDTQTDKIIIAVADYASDHPHKELKHIVELTDTDDITLITDSIAFPSWEKVKGGNVIAAEPYFYIIINDNIMIYMLSDTAYGGVIEYTLKDSMYIGKDYSGDYVITQQFFTTIWQLVEPYSEQLDVEIYQSE